jgi:hypothetical protein
MMKSGFGVDGSESAMKSTVDQELSPPWVDEPAELLRLMELETFADITSSSFALVRLSRLACINIQKNASLNVYLIHKRRGAPKAAEKSSQLRARGTLGTDAGRLRRVGEGSA